jgi:hypothetical protein
LVQIARQVADLLTPTAPKGISYDFDQNIAASVLADPDKVFRDPVQPGEQMPWRSRTQDASAQDLGLVIQRASKPPAAPADRATLPGSEI